MLKGALSGMKLKLKEVQEVRDGRIGNSVDKKVNERTGLFVIRNEI